VREFYALLVSLGNIAEAGGGGVTWVGGTSRKRGGENSRPLRRSGRKRRPLWGGGISGGKKDLKRGALRRDLPQGEKKKFGIAPLR